MDLLTDAGRGDIMAWRSPVVEAHVGPRPCRDPREHHARHIYGSLLCGAGLRFTAAQAHFSDLPANPAVNLRHEQGWLSSTSAPGSSI